jgi:4-amino-4-deoxy-L-arabinose transferase-like glycosyltransferase
VGRTARQRPSSLLGERLLVNVRLSIALLVACAALYAYAALLNPGIYLWGDEAHYIIVAKAIATGQGLRDIHTPGAPPFAYPIPLFPLALAPIVARFDYDLIPLKLFVAFTGVLALLAVFALFRRLLDPTRALVLTALVAITPQIVSFTHQVMTEIPYMALSATALLLLIAAAKSDRVFGREAVLLIGTLTAAVLTRSIGVSLIAAACAYLLIDGAGALRERLTRSALVALLTGGAWLAVNASMLNRMTYVRELEHGTGGAPVVEGTAASRIAHRVAWNLPRFASAGAETVVYPTFKQRMPRAVAVKALVIALCGVGFVFAAILRRSPLEYYAVFYIAVLVVYDPANAGNLRRYMVPIVPLFLYYALRGLEAGGFAIGRFVRCRPPAWASSLTMLVLIGVPHLANTVDASFRHTTPEMFDYDLYTNRVGHERMARWIGAKTPPQSVVATSATFLDHLWSRRRVVYIPALGADVSRFASALRRRGVTHLAIDSVTAANTKGLATAVAADTADFTLIYDEPSDRAYRVRTAPNEAAAR